MQMPTGTGKTFLMAAVVRENAADGVLVVTHRIELVEQISETLSRFGVRHGVIAGGQKALLAENVRVASIQTLSRCIDSLSSCPSVVVVDGLIMPWRRPTAYCGKSGRRLFSWD